MSKVDRLRFHDSIKPALCKTRRSRPASSAIDCASPRRSHPSGLDGSSPRRRGPHPHAANQSQLATPRAEEIAINGRVLAALDVGAANIVNQNGRARYDMRSHCVPIARNRLNAVIGIEADQIALCMRLAPKVFWYRRP